ncbi:MAG TPA: transglycosylase SLT domain-containing protein [Noviherbaspirillum sp.]
MIRRTLLAKASLFGASVLLRGIAGMGNALAAETNRKPARPASRYLPIPDGYVRTGQMEQVPPAVLYGVALQESARMFGQYALPYPWTLNVAGEPRRFRTHAEAVNGLRESVRRGITSVDCGLMQVNWRYHNKKLGDYHRALDPYPNLRVGAQILRDHYADTRDWFKAVGRYHSPGDAARAESYARSVFHRISMVAHA